MELSATLNYLFTPILSDSANFYFESIDVRLKCWSINTTTAVTFTSFRLLLDDNFVY